MAKFSLDLVVEKGYSHWSLENVSTPSTRALLDEYCERYPDKMAYATLDAADYGVPQHRVRLIAANPATIRLMRQQPVRRVTVSDAFAAAGFALPATRIKSNTSNRDGSPCIRASSDSSTGFSQCGSSSAARRARHWFGGSAASPLARCTRHRLLRSGLALRCVRIP